MTSKKTIAERNLTTIQVSKETVQRLRQAESYPRETYDRIIARLVEVHMVIAGKLKGVESYPHEPIESIVARLVQAHNRRIPMEEQVKKDGAGKVNSDKSDAAKAFQKELAKITGQK
jgi:predicted YcjX-like family ATPase